MGDTAKFITVVVIVILMFGAIYLIPYTIDKNRCLAAESPRKWVVTEYACYEMIDNMWIKKDLNAPKIYYNDAAKDMK